MLNKTININKCIILVPLLFIIVLTIWEVLRMDLSFEFFLVLLVIYSFMTILSVLGTIKAFREKSWLWVILGLITLFPVLAFISFGF